MVVAQPNKRASEEKEPYTKGVWPWPASCPPAVGATTMHGTRSKTCKTWLHVPCSCEFPHHHKCINSSSIRFKNCNKKKPLKSKGLQSQSSPWRTPSGPLRIPKQQVSSCPIPPRSLSRNLLHAYNSKVSVCSVFFSSSHQPISASIEYLRTQVSEGKKITRPCSRLWSYKLYPSRSAPIKKHACVFCHWRVRLEQPSPPTYIYNPRLAALRLTYCTVSPGALGRKFSLTILPLPL